MYLWPQRDRKRLKKFDHWASWVDLRRLCLLSGGFFHPQSPPKSVGNDKFISQAVWSQRRKLLIVNMWWIPVGFDFALREESTHVRVSRTQKWLSFRNKMTSFAKLSRFNRINSWKTFSFVTWKFDSTPFGNRVILFIHTFCTSFSNHVVLHVAVNVWFSRSKNQKLCYCS